MYTNDICKLKKSRELVNTPLKLNQNLYYCFFNNNEKLLIINNDHQSSRNL